MPGLPLPCGATESLAFSPSTRTTSKASPSRCSTRHLFERRSSNLGDFKVSREINNLWDSRRELRTKKRRGGSGAKGSVALASHVTSGPDAAIYSARKISGRPCVPGKLGKNRAPADSLRLGFLGSVFSSSAGGRLFQDFRPRRASLRSSIRTEPTGPKPTRPEKRRARLATALNRLFQPGE